MYISLDRKISNLLQQCTFKQLKQIHAFIITTSLHLNIKISSKFLRRSTEFGSMEYPKLVFSHLGGVNGAEITLWNAMIRGYDFNGPFEMSASLFDEMRQRGLKPHNYTYPYVLNSCSKLGWRKIGKKVQCLIMKSGFEFDSSVAYSLFNMYAFAEREESFEIGVVEIEKIHDARKILEGMCFKPIELCNRMISMYAAIGDVQSARQLFDEMSQRDIVSWNTMTTTYARAGDTANARNLFDKMPEKNVVSWTAMIKAYSDSKDLKTAREIFQTMPEKNAVSWNSMISGYTQNGEFQEALNLFARMQIEGVNLDGFTFVSALSACSQLGALEFGKWIHSLIQVQDWPIFAINVGTSLVEMYAKCGDFHRAFTIFIKLNNKDVFCYNVMIKSLAINGKTEDAIKIFYSMQNRGLKPNSFTLTSALFACSHGGLVQEGRNMFQNMEKNYGFCPNLEHYGCMIDLLSRNGLLEEAELMLKEMPFEADIAVWGALLGGCRVKEDVEMAARVMKRAGVLEGKESGVYALLANIRAAVGEWEEAVGVRMKMEDRSIRKRTGHSSVIL